MRKGRWWQGALWERCRLSSFLSCFLSTISWEIYALKFWIRSSVLAETTIYDLNGDMISSLVSCIDAKKKKKLLFCYLLFAAFVWLRLVSNQISMLSSFFFMYHDMIFSSHFPEKKSHEVNEKLFITISLHFTTVFTQNIWNLCRISYNFLVN